MLKFRQLKEQDTIEINDQIIKSIAEELTLNKVVLNIYPNFKSGVIKYVEYLKDVNLYLYFNFIDETHVQLQCHQYDKSNYTCDFVFDVTIKYAKDQYEISQCSIGANVVNDKEAVIEEIARMENYFIVVVGYFYYALEKNFPVQDILLPSKKCEVTIGKIKISTWDKDFKNKLLRRYYQSEHTVTVQGYYRTLKDGTQIYIKPYTRKAANN